jgi:hypothetical protein
MGGVVINDYSSATQGVIEVDSLKIGENFNTNSAYRSTLINLYNQQNAGAGTNTGLYILSSSTDFISNGSAPAGSGVDIQCSGTAINCAGADSVSLSSNGLVRLVIGNTQSAASVLQKIDTGTSSQDHMWLDLTGTRGAIRIGTTTAPSVTTNKLYNVGGTLTWNGTAI